MTLRAGGRDTPADRAAGPRRPGPGSTWIGLGISLVVHVVLVLSYAAFAGRLRPETASFPLPTASGEPAGGLVVLRIVEFDDEEALAIPEPEEVAVPELEAPAAPFPGVEEEPGQVLVEPGRTVAERLRPNLRDPRIWAPDRALGALTPELLEELVVAGLLEEWVDSMRAAAAADSALTDWTVTGEDGKRWGVANGRIYLGDYSLPLPFEFGVNPWARQQANDRMYQWEEITRQGRTMEIRDGWRERAQAIRERRDRERAQADTTRGPGA